MTIEQLKQQIEMQKQINTELYKSIPIASKDDPRNLKAEPILKEWREGSKNIRELISELNKMQNERKFKEIIKESNDIFVNSFGEATKREITCQAYERANNRLEKQILSFIGSK